MSEEKRVFDPYRRRPLLEQVTSELSILGFLVASIVVIGGIILVGGSVLIAVFANLF